MAQDKTLLYEDAVALLERINQELKESKHLNSINSRMVYVVKEINDVRIEEIAGQSEMKEE
jgi:hypothetical protein